MLIRAVRDDDWEGCLAVDRSYETDVAWQMDERQEGDEWHISFREIRLPRTLKVSSSVSEDNLLRDWENRDRFWVAVDQRMIIGYLALDVDQFRHQAKVTDLVVAPDHRRRGVASALLGRALEWCSRQHVRQIVLLCPLKAQPAIRFAIKHGFTFCGFQDGYWPSQEIALFFVRRVR